MTQLEKIYLLNVMIYIHELHTLRQFLEINHKCREVGLMLRIFTARKNYLPEKGTSVMSLDPFVPKDTYDLFPSIETIECNFKELFKDSTKKIFDKVKKIRVSYNVTTDEMKEINEQQQFQFFNKIETLRIHKSEKTTLLPLNLNNFTNLKKVIIVNKINFHHFLNNNFNLKLDELVLRFSNYLFDDNPQKIIEELLKMKKYKFIKRKTLMIWRTSPEVIKELEKIFDVVCCPNLSVIDCSEFYFEKEKCINLSNILIYTRSVFMIVNQCLAEIIHYLDLRKCHSIERITIRCDSKQHIKIEGLQHLREIEFFNNFNQYDVNEISLSVTKIVCRNFSSQENISNFLYRHPNIKSLVINQVNNYKEIPNVVKTFLPRKDIKLDEIIFKMNMYSKDKKMLKLSNFFEMVNYPNIKQKTLIIDCEDYIPKYEEVQQLRRIMNVEITLLVSNVLSTKYLNLNKTTEEIKRMIILGNFDWRLVDQPKQFIDVEYIDCLCLCHPTKKTFLNLSAFSNCK